MADSFQKLDLHCTGIVNFKMPGSCPMLSCSKLCLLMFCIFKVTLTCAFSL